MSADSTLFTQDTVDLLCDVADQLDELTLTDEEKAQGYSTANAIDLRRIGAGIIARSLAAPSTGTIDTERLDWLEENYHEVYPTRASGVSWLIHSTRNIPDEFPSIRAAIDAARRSPTGEPKP